MALLVPHRWLGLLASQAAENQVVAHAFAAYQGVSGGAFYDRAGAERQARDLINMSSQVARRRAARDALGALAPRATRSTVAGGTSTARPTGRSAVG